MNASTPIPPIPSAELAHVPLPIEACPRCGSMGLRPARYHEGAVAGSADLFSERVCPRCAYRGLPLAFRERETYAAFVRELNDA